MLERPYKCRLDCLEFFKKQHSVVSGGFHALSKIRQSLREKKPPLGKRAGTVEEVSSVLDSVKGDLQVPFDQVTLLTFMWL